MKLPLKALIHHGPKPHQRLRKRVRKAKAVRPSRANELWYKAELLAVTRWAHQIAVETIVPELQWRVEASQPVAHDAALSVATINAIIEKAARRMGSVKARAEKLAVEAVTRNVKAVDAQVTSSVKASIGVDISGALGRDAGMQSVMRTAALANVDLITSIPTEHLDKIREWVMKTWTEGTRWEDLAEAIEHAEEVSESRAKLIARDQTSKMNAAFNEERQTSLGIEEYEWQTSGDERVRDSHAEKDGQRFRWDDPPADTGHPGEDIQCRCTALAIIDLDELAEEAAA